jgi:cyclophilin family peptidyl-prolyl cis-trans isomerase
MLRAITAVLIPILAFVVLIGCSGDTSEKADTPETETKAETRPPWFATPQFTGEDPAQYRHPIRDENNRLVMLETNVGNMMIELYRDVAPAHADSFVVRVQEGFYDSLGYHRIIDKFMIQTGSFTADGRPREVNYTLNAEFSELPHYEGTVAAARTPDPNSAATGFYICLQRNNQTESLDKQYTVFGHLITGYDVLHRIGKVPVVRQGQAAVPQELIVIERAYLCDADGNPV